MEDTIRLVDMIGFLVSLVITFIPIGRVKSLTQVAVTNDDMLTAPLLCVHDRGIAAIRCQCWLLVSVFHSCTMLLYEYKDHGAAGWDFKLLFWYFGPAINLIVSFVLLIYLVCYYPITKVTEVIIGFGFIAYLSIVLTDLACLKSTVIWEILLIPITMCMHAMRFASQEPLTKFEWMPFSVAVLGFTPGILCLIPPHNKSLTEYLMQHIPFKMATLIAAASRLSDAIFLCYNKTREKGNYFRSRLQECFL